MWVDQMVSRINSSIHRAKLLIFAFLITMMSFTAPVFAENVYEKLYSNCLDTFGTINNSIVTQCSDQVIQVANSDIASKLEALRRTRLSESFDRFMQGHRHWKTYMEIQCEIQTRYIGSPMYKYCPMKMTINRVKEIDLLVDSLIH